MAQTKRSRGEKSSKYFAFETPPSKASVCSSTSSRHFLDSPSSAIGSVSSMPSFLETLAPIEFDESTSCSCQRLVESASLQFAHCETFQESSSKNSSTCKAKSHCCDECTLDFQRRLCHLCPHGCYLRAFAPLREWHSLRESVAEISDVSPDVVLKGWKCCLANRLNPEQDDCRKRKRTKASPLVQTIFMSPNGKSFKGRNRVLKELGLDTRSGDLDAETVALLPRSLKLDFCSQPTKQDDNINILVTSTALYNKSNVSPFGLLEELFRKDPWRLLLSTIMLNRTTRCQVDVVLYEFLCKWPDAASTSVANEEEIATVIRPMGMTFRRARAIIRFSKEWLSLLQTKTPNNAICGVEFSLTKQDVMGLYNCGTYAYQCYRIFIQGDFYGITTDHALQIYVNYRRGLALKD